MCDDASYGTQNQVEPPLAAEGLPLAAAAATQQTTFLWNDHHHPLLIEFEKDRLEFR
jgi:hypothetical protein